MIATFPEVLLIKFRIRILLKHMLKLKNLDPGRDQLRLKVIP